MKKPGFMRFLGTQRKKRRTLDIGYFDRYEDSIKEFLCKTFTVEQPVAREKAYRWKIRAHAIISFPVFAACMGMMCLVSSESIGLLLFGIKLSLLSIMLFVVSSIITSSLIMKKRN